MGEASNRKVSFTTYLALWCKARDPPLGLSVGFATTSTRERLSVHATEEDNTNLNIPDGSSNTLV